MAETLNWDAKEAYSLRLSNLELLHAIEDCRVASFTVPETAIGKDAAYYRDELSVYHNEWQRRVTTGALTDAVIAALWREVANPTPTTPSCPLCGRGGH